MPLIKIIINSLYVFSITCAFYVVFFSGIPQTSDEDLFLSAARNIVVNGDLTAPEVYGSTRLQGDYHGVEPAHPVLASLWYRFVSSKLPVGRVQGLYLLPVLYTGLTAGLIVVLSTQMNYSVQTGIAAGVLYGISTIALPYSKTFYRETLASVLMILTWVLFESALRNKHFWTRIFFVGAVVFLTLLILLTKVALVFFVLAFTFMLIARTNDEDKRNIRLMFFFIVLGLFILILIVKSLFKLEFDSTVFYRFTGDFANDAMARYRGIGHGYFWEAVLAPLFSPWKGFFIYSPICFMAFPSFKKLYDRKQMYVIVVAFITLAGLLVIQALAYDNEWWTITWGARHLLPCIPLFVVASLPWIEKALENPHSPSGIGLIFIFLMGTFIQLGAVVFNPIEYNWFLFEKTQDLSSEVIWSLSKAPLWGQWSLLIKGVKPDIVLWRLFENENIALFVFVALVLLLVGFLFVVWRNLNNPRESTNIKKLTQSAVLIGTSLAVFIFFYSRDTYYHLYSPQIMDVCNELNNRVTQRDLVLIKPYRSKIWFYFMNSSCLKYEWYSLPYNIEIMNNSDAMELTARLLDENASSAERIWLVSQVWSGPDKLDEMLQADDYSLIESSKYPFDDTLIVFSLYKKHDQ